MNEKLKRKGKVAGEDEDFPKLSTPAECGCQSRDVVCNASAQGFCNECQ